jgi:hypothetical protein
MNLKEIRPGSFNAYRWQNKNKNILLWKMFFKFGVHQMGEKYWLAEEIVASYKQLFSMEWNSLVQKDIRSIYIYSSSS